MKKLILIALCALSARSYGQVPFLTIDSMNVNKINASVLVHGDMWWNANASSYTTKGFFPNGTRLSFGGFGNAIWMSGYDASMAMHVAAATYRQNGNDYWPGPLDGTTAITYGQSRDWAKIWKVSRADILHLSDPGAHTIDNIPQSILTWPARGNALARGNDGAPLTITTDMAPFVDANGNGIYEPLAGDYPDIKGDLALWWVFNDNGPVHTETNGLRLGVEVHAMCYGYSRGTAIDNVVYYDYEILNKSANNYHDFRLAFRGDMDLGYYMDDYIGFDSAYRMGIQYNAVADDGSAGGHPANSYGVAPPVAGMTFVHLPGDDGSTYVPAGSFTYYNNDGSHIGNPLSHTEYNYYMRSRMRTGAHFTNDYAGPFIPSDGVPGAGSEPNTDYLFPGDPANDAQWSECSSRNNPGDRRFILSSNDFSIAAGNKAHVVMALVITDTSHTNACGSVTFSGIRQLADTARNIYQHPLAPARLVSPLDERAELRVFPNPADNTLHVALGGRPVKGGLSVLDATGRTMNVPMTTTGAECLLDVSSLAPGMYLLHYNDGSMRSVVRFTRLANK